MEIYTEIKKVFEMACSSVSTVLITGETGTGKSTLAKKIHEASARAAKPFIVVNLATLHEGTLESDLFGHERGAFTGADRKRVGKLELAHTGTVFLDELGEMSPRLQARLLEFLQSGVITPLGSSRQIQLDVRVIAATHRDLQREVVKGNFRADLYHRLRVLPIELKSLRERSYQFDSILQESLLEISQKHGKPVKAISLGAAEKLGAHAWPGNIRELRNVLEYAVVAAEGPILGVEHLPAWMSSAPDPLQDPDLATGAVLGVAEFALTLDYFGTRARFEKEYLLRALGRNGGLINRTARQIGLNKATLIKRLRAYGIHPGPRRAEKVALALEAV